MYSNSHDFTKIRSGSDLAPLLKRAQWVQADWPDVDDKPDELAYEFVEAVEQYSLNAHKGFMVRERVGTGAEVLSWLQIEQEITEYLDKLEGFGLHAYVTLCSVPIKVYNSNRTADIETLFLRIKHVNIEQLRIPVQLSYV